MSDETERHGPVARRAAYRRRWKDGEWITAKRPSYYYVTPDQEADEAAFHADIEEEMKHEAEQARIAFEASDAAKFWPSSGIVEFQCPWCAAKTHDTCEPARSLLHLDYFSLCPVCRNHIAVLASEDGIEVQAIEDFTPMPDAIVFGNRASMSTTRLFPLPESTRTELLERFSEPKPSKTSPAD